MPCQLQLVSGWFFCFTHSSTIQVVVSLSVEDLFFPKCDQVLILRFPVRFNDEAVEDALRWHPLWCLQSGWIVQEDPWIVMLIHQNIFLIDKARNLSSTSFLQASHSWSEIWIIYIMLFTQCPTTACFRGHAEMKIQETGLRQIKYVKSWIFACHDQIEKQNFVSRGQFEKYIWVDFQVSSPRKQWSAGIQMLTDDLL